MASNHFLNVLSKFLSHCTEEKIKSLHWNKTNFLKYFKDLRAYVIRSLSLSKICLYGLVRGSYIFLMNEDEE